MREICIDVINSRRLSYERNMYDVINSCVYAVHLLIEGCLLHCVAIRCSMLQSVALHCRVLQCAATRCRALQCVAVLCSALQCIAVSECNVTQQELTLEHCPRQAAGAWQTHANQSPFADKRQLCETHP